jgi:ribosomal subunit interface protein
MMPVQVTIRDLPHSQAIENHIRMKAEKFHHSDRINQFKVVVTLPQKHKHNGKLYCVRIDLTVPGREIIVNRQVAEDVYVAIRDAFNALSRQLENHVRRRRGEVKTHTNEARGVVKKLFLDEGYGFIQGIDGNEHYFSGTNVANSLFDQLKIGDPVAFLSVLGGDGMQANHVTMV